MKKLNEKEQMQVNGGHVHWVCAPCDYKSVARDSRSAQAWSSLHNTKYNHPYLQGAICWDCNNDCGKIYTNMP
ncbi:MAG: hypothetical protein E7222_08325 [Clostridiales bacterium]|nr:hypothetical protein [Clostridiales bacterium]